VTASVAAAATGEPLHRAGRVEVAGDVQSSSASRSWAPTSATVGRRERLGGLLNFYYRRAA